MGQKWKISFSDIVFGEEEKAAVARVLESGWVTMGPEVEAFEHEFADALGARFAVAVSSGTAALHLALRVAGVGPGDEVICPSLTFVATANAVLYTGATPRFADIASARDLNISPRAIREKVNDRTRAIIVVHYGGYPCDMEAIGEIAREGGLALIEDAAHAPLATAGGRALGTLGDFGCFSFFSNKNMTCAEGGMVVTSDEEKARRLRSLRSHALTASTTERHSGRARTYDVADLGFNYRMDEIRAAIGRVQLRKCAANNARRRRIVERYRAALAGLDGLEIPFGEFRGRPSYHLFPILLAEGAGDRDRFRSEIERRGIETSIHYPPVHLTSYYRRRVPTAAEHLAVTENVASRLVTLPLHPHLSERDAEEVADAVRAALDAI